MSASDWEQATTDRIGAQILRARKELNLSAQGLADRTAKLGYPIGRATISQFENGTRRSVTVAELLILAAALNTSPVSLIYPGPYRQSVSVIPGRVVTEFQAAQWFSALEWLNTVLDFDASQDLAELVARGFPEDEAAATAGAFRAAALEARQQWRDRTKELGLWRLRDELQTRLNELMRKRDFAADHDQIGTYTKMIQELSAQVRDQ